MRSFYKDASDVFFRPVPLQMVELVFHLAMKQFRNLAITVTQQCIKLETGLVSSVLFLIRPLQLYW